MNNKQFYPLIVLIIGIIVGSIGCKIDKVKLNKDLVIACRKGNFVEIQKLLGKGAYIEVKFKYDGYTHTPLSWAVKNRQMEIVKYLISKGANVNAGINGPETTPLMWACKNDDIYLIKYLI